MNDVLWYSARASGLVGWLLLATASAWGLALSSKVRVPRARPAWTLDLHRYLGGLATAFTLVHVTSIMADTYVHFGPVEVLVPFASSWKPGAVAAGIVAFYLLLAVELTSLARRRMPERVWRRIHALAFPLFVVCTVHLLTAGTDASSPLVRLVVIVGTGLVLVLSCLRAATAARRRTMPPRVRVSPVRPDPWVLEPQPAPPSAASYAPPFMEELRTPVAPRG